MRVLSITLAALLLVLASLPDDVDGQTTEVTNVTDQHGNVVYSNGTIVWLDPIPAGNNTYVTSNEYDDGGLGTIFALARSFINTVQPSKFPLDVLKKVLNGTFDIGKDYMDHLNIWACQKKR